MMPSWSAQSPPSGIQPAVPPPPPGYSYQPTPVLSYIPVQTRQSFAAYPPPPPPQYGMYSAPSQPVAPPPQMNPSDAHPKPAASAVETKKQQKIDWPESVRDYVRRSFLSSNLDPTISSDDLQAKLKEIIGSAQAQGMLHQVDWHSIALPQEMIRAERQASLKPLMANLSSPSQPVFHAGLTGEPSHVPKKRKSSDLADDDAASTNSPWRSTNNPSRSSVPLGDRITRPAMDEPLPKSSKFPKEKRAKRSNGDYKSTFRSPTPPPATGPVVGTSEVLEKRYLRLTAPPVPSQVRPEHILRQTLDLLKRKWKKESNYSYICDQFKSMRQDLTVQRIKNDFTVSVYEIHARIALEKGDLGEYNQCQTQLRSLYALGLNGNSVEFKAYRILYFIHTANRTGLNEVLADLTPAEKEELPVKHALNVRSALALGNYHRFFQLYLDTPNMGAYLMDMFVVRERLAALCNICKAYKPDVKLRFITEELGFESDADAAQFIVDHNGQHLLEDRQDTIAFLTAKAGPLFESARATAFARIDIKGQI